MMPERAASAQQNNRNSLRTSRHMLRRYNNLLSLLKKIKNEKFDYKSII